MKNREKTIAKVKKRMRVRKQRTLIQKSILKLTA